MRGGDGNGMDADFGECNDGTPQEDGNDDDNDDCDDRKGVVNV